MKSNIEQIFARFVSEGKATLRMKDPPHDVCISKVSTLIVNNLDKFFIENGKSAGYCLLCSFNFFSKQC